MADTKDKYAGLPDLDEGPDLFDTPELTDDTSTAPPASATEDGDGNELIDRNHIDRREANSRFAGSRVDARGADFSDRINGERKSYQIKSRRRRRRGTVTEEENEEEEDDWSEDEEPTPEGLRRRLARLTREAAELKSELERKEAEGEKLDMEGVGSLEENLGALNTTIAHGERSAQERLKQRLDSKPTTAQASDIKSSSTATGDGVSGYTITYVPTYNSSHALAKAASFDTRLAAIEAMLGADSTTIPTQDHSAYRKPVLPTLDILDKQITTLSSTSAATLEGVHKRVQALVRETERLEEARRAARHAHDSLPSPQAGRSGERASSSGDGELALDDPEQVAKINALHGTLPTIEALAPVLPGLLDRLRSLRLLHTDAANAENSLNELEKKQAEMDSEIAEWQESLEKVESMLGQAESNTKANMKVVEGWVSDLSGRVKSLNA